MRNSLPNISEAANLVPEFENHESLTYPDFACPCTSVTLMGPERFLDNAVGAMGTLLSGVSLNTVAGVSRSNVMWKMKFWWLPW